MSDRASGNRQDDARSNAGHVIHKAAGFFALVSAAAVTVTLQLVFLVAPIERQMGIIQKIFYFHVPSAFAMYVGALACFAGSAAYLSHATPRRDALAKAGAEVAVIFGAIVLVTGPLWAAKAWGAYWTWEPRLTSSLLSVLIYVAYLVLRSFGGDSDSIKRFAAALGFLGAVNLPIIHFSVRKWSGQHPQVVFQGGGGLGDPMMKVAFAAGLVTFAFFSLTLLLTRYRLNLAEERVTRLELEAAQTQWEDAPESSAGALAEHEESKDAAS